MADLKCVIEDLEINMDRGKFCISMWDEEGSELDFCLIEKELLDDLVDYLCAKRDGRKPLYVRDGLPEKIVCCKGCASAADMGEDSSLCMCKRTNVLHEKDFWCKAGKERE